MKDPTVHLFHSFPHAAIIRKALALLVLPFLPFFFFKSVHASASAGAQPVKWLRQGIVASSDMEGLTFVLRRGGEDRNTVQDRHEQRSEKAIRRLKEAGVNLAIINFYKGAGLKAESEDIAAARRFTELAHQYGIKVAGYVGSTLMYETLFQEEPDARNWRQVDEFGDPIYYTPDQTFRYVACRNNPNYRAFIKKVVRIGVEDLKLDVIHFDQMTWWPEPHSCRCQYCRAQFREFLEKRYSDPARARLRFGFTNFNGVIPPPFGVHEPPVRLPDLHNPIMQEWAQFRAWSLARDFQEFSDYIHGLNPNVAVIANPSMNMANNVGWINGVDPQQLFPAVDGVWTEESNLPEWTSDGRLVSMIRSYKAARTMGRTVFHWQDLKGFPFYKEAPAALRLAESLAYNDANLGVVAGPDAAGDDLTPLVTRYIKFFRSHLNDLTHTKEVADVAILRSFASTQFNPLQSNFATVLFEQSLIQSKIPFSIIFDRQLSDLSRYRVLVLADEDALSDEQIQQIRAFVTAGGGLVVTGNTSMLTEWRQRRNKFGLADLLGIDTPPETSAPNRPTQRQIGNGRVVYVPRIDAAVPAPAAVMNYSIDNTFWKLPANYTDLLSAVRWAAAGNYSVTVDAPLWVTTELVQRENAPTRLLHLVNFKVDQPVKSVRVRLHLPTGMRLSGVTLLDPDQDEEETLAAVSGHGEISLTVPQLNTYCLLRFKMIGD